jgi:imidazolonepropionase
MKIIDCDTIITNIGELATSLPSQAFTIDNDGIISPVATAQAKDLLDLDLVAKGRAMGDVIRLEDAAIGIKDGVITYAGKRSRLASETTANGAKLIDAGGHLVTAGLIDPHTHTIFDGNRANEFIMRCQGKSYQEIAEAGGGIVASTSATRGATLERLLALGMLRLERMLAAGTTTCEIKTGYGLDQQTELTMLQCILQLSRSQPISIIPTFMPAHAVPKNIEHESYVDDIINHMLLAAKELCSMDEAARHHTYVDAFCDRGYFTLDDTRRIFAKALDLGFLLKVHADEFVNLGATTLACQMGAHSADHLLNVSEKEMGLLAKSHTVATLLPGTSFYLNLKEHARARLMIEKGVAVALGSDFNPGSCHIFSLPFIWGLSCLHLKLTCAEALSALTINAGAAIGLNRKGKPKVGIIAPGCQADINIYSVDRLEEIPYNIGFNPVSKVVKAGKTVFGA